MVPSAATASEQRFFYAHTPRGVVVLVADVAARLGHVCLPGPVGEAASGAARRPAARSRDDAQARTSEPYRKPTTGTT
ncbi:hypothetical protein ADK57_06675 [Streptomyces sp. MMG1533]|uniref:hypothetical protein n=1 Tax=Streptomyces sp. MMG1533 TaxID=1415546 RepID=UPI0006B0233B|nr:hypothetical protein [Streptomyces sp. MMG1533]KOU75129.1 hypothetical protein ADK57_06675 [Streptomyces sp. MMG1533]